ncbi:hypothetical protein SAMN07250955_101222 [Arboricoccus pini]|uniref:Uncharacterized protein n=1 Tax=Arboricoccus pini TaxID=1963835 RepID=A0A212PYZ6_9PROT|nr:hypothetical protein SAMN07250955_101222 [Arboricoccus pini]
MRLVLRDPFRYEGGGNHRRILGLPGDGKDMDRMTPPIAAGRDQPS